MRKKTIEEFKKEVEIKGNEEYEVLSNNYFGNKIPLKIRHKICGYEYEATPNNFISGYRCPLCGGTKKKDTDYFKKEVFDLVDNEYKIMDNYKNDCTKIKFYHNCGKEFMMTPHNFISGQRCPYCYGNMRKSQGEFEKEVFVKYGDEYSVLGKYKNYSTKILIKHNVCGTEWNVRPNDFIGKSSGCPNCCQSRGEAEIQRNLNNMNIFYEKQKKYNDLTGKNNRKLSYDFYIPGQNLLIEFQGKQHYKPIKHFGGEKAFKKQQKYDELKRNYAKENNIELLEIGYWNFKKIGEILYENLR